MGPRGPAGVGFCVKCQLLFIVFLFTRMADAYKLETCELLLDETPQGSANVPRQYVFKIRDMANEDKPRERMVKFGAAALSVAELTAVVLGTGTKKEDLMSMSTRIIRDYGQRVLSLRIHPSELAKELDIPLAKALQISACAELGRRFYDRRGQVLIRTAQDVYDYLVELRQAAKENLRGLYLNTHHRLIHDEVISLGTVNTNLIHPREVFRPAIECGAAALILAHNHPSGIITPSDADIAITNHLIAAGKIIGIPIVDHIIIGRDGYMSIEADY